MLNPSLLPRVFDLPWWVYALVALALTHLTIVSVTIFLHRSQAHRALDLHSAASHFFRFWLWLTTGMVTRQWVAVHRKHHARVETLDDPHSPQQLGINRVLWGGVLLYVRESRDRQTLERYGHGTPDDWLERNIYSRFPVLGLSLMGTADIALFGPGPGTLILVTQLVWIPFWAAGVINGIGHFWGYRNWSTEDASTNIFPWGILIGGEELHNNHHASVTSAKLSNKWYELDIGWLYIRLLETFGLARVRKIAVAPSPSKPASKLPVHSGQPSSRIATREFRHGRRGPFSESSLILLGTVGVDGKLSFVSEAWGKVLGHMPEELSHRPLCELMQHERSAAVALVDQLLGERGVNELEFGLRCRDGTCKWFHWHRWFDPQSRMVSIAGYDITDQKSREIASMLRSYERGARA